MNNLPLPLLIKALEEAIRLNLASDFIQMIEREISKRQAS
ncbi:MULTISPECIES: sporulation histidine kinase inhibitor Sda [Jeotgalibacillus]|nr:MULTISPECIES: sporulation histidine kinase inhibitor Sda [Jeotgalibacillus]TFD92360.1 sporulation histidine kinase inhibitor Sda [Jeotgalibacillus sp. R-1-5s-1]